MKSPVEQLLAMFSKPLQGLHRTLNQPTGAPLLSVLFSLLTSLSLPYARGDHVPNELPAPVLV